MKARTHNKTKQLDSKKNQKLFLLLLTKINKIDNSLGERERGRGGRRGGTTNIRNKNGGITINARGFIK